MTDREGPWDQGIGFIKIGGMGTCFYARSPFQEELKIKKGDGWLSPAPCSTQMNKQNVDYLVSPPPIPH